MFPIGIRIWNQNRMVYPVKFSVYLDINQNISFIKTTAEGKKYQTFNYMMLAPAVAINGYIYEKDIIMIDGEESKTGVVLYDSTEGGFTVKTKDGKIAINESLSFCEILGNVYEDIDILKDMKITYKDEVISEDFTDNSSDEKEDIKREVIKKERTPEVKKDDFVESDKKPKEQPPQDNKVDKRPPWESYLNNSNKKEEKTQKTIKENEKIKDTEKEIPNKKQSEEPVKSEIKPESKSESKKPEIDTIDSNLIMGAEDLPYLSDEEELDEPLDESILDGVEITEIEEPGEELPPDDLFGNDDADITPPKKKEPLKIKAKTATIYAVGYCGENSGPGTYSYTIEANGKTFKDVGGIKDTVINKIQLISIIEALKNIESCEELKIYSDSKYVIFPLIKGWVYKWQANNWKKDTGSTVKDSELWEEIYNLTKDISIQWEFVSKITEHPQIVDCMDKAKKEIAKYM